MQVLASGDVRETVFDIVSSSVADCSGGLNTSYGAAGCAGAVVRSGTGSILDIASAISFSSFTNCDGGRDNMDHSGGGGVGFVVCTNGDNDNGDAANAGRLQNASFVLRNSNISNSSGGTYSTLGGAGGYGVVVSAKSMLGVSTLVDGSRVVRCTGGHNNDDGGGAGGIGMLASSSNPDALGLDLVNLTVTGRSHIADCSGGNNNAVVRKVRSRGTHPFTASSLGVGGGVGLGVIATLHPISHLHGLIHNASLTFNGGSSAVNCTGGENNAVIGGAGGVGFVISSPSFVEGLIFDVSDASIIDCVGGNNNSLGGGGGVGLAVLSNDVGHLKPHPGVISGSFVRVARSTIIGCRGGSRNKRFGGGGGLGVAIFSDKGSASDNAVVLDSSRIESCVGGKGNKYASGSGGVGVTVHARTGIVSGEQLRIKNSTITACEADSGGGAALVIRGVGAEGRNAFEIEHTVLEGNVARGSTGCGGGGVRALFIPSLPSVQWPPIVPGGNPDDYNNFHWVYNESFTAVPEYVSVPRARVHGARG